MVHGMSLVAPSFLKFKQNAYLKVTALLRRSCCKDTQELRPAATALQGEHDSTQGLSSCGVASWPGAAESMGIAVDYGTHQTRSSLH